MRRLQCWSPAHDTGNYSPISSFSRLNSLLHAKGGKPHSLLPHKRGARCAPLGHRQ